MDIPPTRYAQVGDADVAYKVTAGGPIDVVFFYGLGAHVELSWDPRVSADFYSRLAAFSRLIIFDRRGTGASDGLPGGAFPTWEEWTEDVRAVLDAVSSDQAAIVAGLDAGPMAILFAALHPERVRALVLYTTTARYLLAEDYPVGLPAQRVEAVVRAVAERWGSPEIVAAGAPSVAADSETAAWLGLQMRAAATPRSAAAQYRYLLTSMDVRAALPLIQAPTLVLHARRSTFVPVEHSRYLAEHIPGARFVELAEADTVLATSTAKEVAAEIAEFLTGQRPVLEVERVLTTVLFTDIVGSTERVAAMGDQAWRKLLDAHDRMIRERLREFRGREIKTLGDGFLASFDGPARAVRCAATIMDAARSIGVDLRIGLHTGECEVRGDDLGGLAVHIAARIGALAPPNEVVVSSIVKDLIAGSGLVFNDHGEHQLRGAPGSWRLFALRH